MPKEYEAQSEIKYDATAQELLLALHAAAWIDFNQAVKIMGDGNSAAIFDLLENKHIELDFVDGLGSVYAITQQGNEMAEQYRRERGEDRITGYRKERRCAYCGEKIKDNTAIAVTYFGLLTETETEILVHDGLITSDLSSEGYKLSGSCMIFADDEAIKCTPIIDGDISDRHISVDASCYEAWSHYKAVTFADETSGIQVQRIILKK